MSDLLIMVGTLKGAFFLWSDESRTEWRMEGPHLKGWEVSTLTLDQRGDPKVLAGVGHEVYGCTIHISGDLGKSWQQIEHGPAYTKESGFTLNRIWTVVPDPMDRNVLYAGVDEAGLFVSKDGGEHWREIPALSKHETRKEWSPGNGGLCLHTILINPVNARQIWVGISAVGVFRTDDGGKNWSVKNRGLDIIIPSKEFDNMGSCVHRMVMDPQDPKRLYQQNHQGLFRSQNSGDSWERIESGLPNHFGFPMAIDPHDGNTLYVIPQESDEYRFPPDGNLTVYRTLDGGASWHPLSRGLPKGYCYTGVLRQAMDVDTFQETGIYLGTTGGQMFFSRNGGSEWEMLPYLLPRILSITARVIS